MPLGRCTHRNPSRWRCTPEQACNTHRQSVGIVWKETVSIFKLMYNVSSMLLITCALNYYLKRHRHMFLGKPSTKIREDGGRRKTLETSENRSSFRAPTKGLRCSRLACTRDATNSGALLPPALRSA